GGSTGAGASGALTAAHFGRPSGGLGASALGASRNDTGSNDLIGCAGLAGSTGSTGLAGSTGLLGSPALMYSPGLISSTGACGLPSASRGATGAFRPGGFPLRSTPRPPTPPPP